MGRRSINTTKSGKYMNPTDQARKEARKKELKKNKRQRQMVRAAVLKMKDPQQILAELEKIDEMEYNVLQPPPLNEKVLKEKRKKLRETFERVLKMYDKDDPDKWVELKRQEVEYDKKRAHLISYYESVKHAQSVQVDDIPLPAVQGPDGFMPMMPLEIPLPADPAVPSMMMPTKPILKKDSAFKGNSALEMAPGTEPPGIPPGPPPKLKDILAENAVGNIEPAPKKKSIRFSDTIDDGPPGEEKQLDVNKVPIAPQPTSLQRRMLALSGQNIDDFMKEMEEVHRKREKERQAELTARLAGLADSDSDEEIQLPPRPPPLRPPGPPPMHAPPRPPGLMPPGPPRPPGPPLRPPPPPKLMPPSVLSAAPQIVKSATISAAPQIRNLSADVTRFVPSSLRVKRENKKPVKPKSDHGRVPEPKQVPTKDDAYSQFMKEMQGLL